MWTTPPQGFSAATGLTASIKLAFATMVANVMTPGTVRDVAYDATGVELAEVGTSGIYGWTYTQMPDGFIGYVILYTGTLSTATNFTGVTVLGGVGLGPQDEAGAKIGTSGGLSRNQDVIR